MALLGSTSYGFHTDSSLTTIFGGTFQLTHNSDFSDNPQDNSLYFGSAGVLTTLQAASNPGIDQITLTPVYILPVWVTVTVYSLGDSVTPTVSNGKRYTVTTAGTTAVSEPTWPTTIGNTISDGTVVWTCTAGDRPITEITIGTTQASLDTNTPGDPLDIGHTITSGSANAVTIWVRVINTINTVSSTFGNPEIGVNINAVNEYDVVIS